MHSSWADLIRASIFFARTMDCRVKPGNDDGRHAATSAGMTKKDLTSFFVYDFNPRPLQPDRRSS
jgi:hypothetical protein